MFTVKVQAVDDSMRVVGTFESKHRAECFAEYLWALGYLLAQVWEGDDLICEWEGDAAKLVAVTGPIDPMFDVTHPDALRAVGR